MSLPLLFARPDSEDSRNLWAFNHAAIHFTVNDAIFTQKNAKIDSFQLSPINPDDIGLWLYRHQMMHNEANNVLGLTGFDLLELDWNDPDAFQTWLALHGDEHQRWNQALGV